MLVTRLIKKKREGKAGRRIGRKKGKGFSAY